MEHQRVYELSQRYSPPEVDLRQGRIADDYGSEDAAQLPICHQVPEDVTRAHFEYYGWVFPFLMDQDLLFYLYPIARVFAEDPALDCIDSFLYSLDTRLPKLIRELSDAEIDALKEGLVWIWDVGGDRGADWFACKKLQALCGLEVTWED